MKNALSKSLIAFMALFVISLNLHSQNYDLNAFPPLDPKVRTGILPNGMKYFIFSNKLPEKRADFYIAHNVGAILEDDNQNGLAHFTEHMAFNGTQHFQKKGILNYLETIGVKFGQNLNAYTGTDETVYMITSVPLLRQGIIDSCLLVLHDWSNYISFEPSEIEAERGVIREEWRTRSSASERMDNKLRPIMYKGSKYALRNVIGDTAIINHFGHEAINNFYHKWYRPDLQGLIIVGDFDLTDMEAKVKKLFSEIPAVVNPTPKEKYLVPDNVDPLIGIATDKEATYTEITVYYKANPTEDNAKNLGYLKLTLIRRLISSMFNQRMTEIVRKENPPFISASCYYTDYTRTKDAFIGYAQARNNESAKALTALLTEIERLKKHGFTEGELTRSKANLLRSYESQYLDRDKRKNNELTSSSINYFLSNEPNPGIEYMYEFTKNIFPGISLDEINAEIKKYIHPDNMVITLTAPEKEGVTVSSEQDVKGILASIQTLKIDPYVDNLAGKKLIEKEPTPGKVVKTETNKILGTTEWTLSNGMKVVLKPTDFKEDELLLSASSIGGLSAADDSYVMSAQALASVVNESGVGKYSATELSKMLAGKKVSVSPILSGDREGFRGSMSPKDLEIGLQLVYLYFTQPRWDEANFKTWVDRVKSNYVNLDANPRKAFSDTVTVMMNNHSKRFRPINYKLLDEISFEKIKTLYADRFCDPGDFTFVFTGNIDLNSVKPLVEKYLASLPTVKRKDAYKDRGVRPPKGKAVNDFSRENKTPRTTVYVNYNGKCGYTPDDVLAFMTIKHILDIRYVESIREEKGGSYGVSVSYGINDLPEKTFSLTMNFDTDPKLADDLKKLIYVEIEKIIKNGPTDADLQKAKEFFLKQRKDDIKVNSWWINTAISEYYFHNNDLYSGFEDRVNKLTAKSIQEYAAKTLTQGNTIEVIMRPK